MKVVNTPPNTLVTQAKKTIHEKNDSSMNMEYKLIKRIKRIGNNSVNDVEIWNSEKIGEILIKSIPINNYDLSYRQLLQEIKNLRILNIIGANHKEGMLFPTLIEVREDKVSNRIQMIMEYISGKHLDSFHIDEQITYLKQCLVSLDKMFQHMNDKNILQFPRRSNLLIFATFPVFFLVAMLRIRKDYLLHLKNFLLFYLNFNIKNIFQTEYSFAHRDLHSKNILVKNSNKIVILDPAISSLCQKETDLAIIARYYYSAYKKKLIKFINSELSDYKSKRIFTFLTLFYAYQSIIVEDSDIDQYNNSLTYLSEFDSIIHSGLQNHKLTFAEMVYSKILNIIYVLDKPFKKIKQFSRVKKIILCYHSINYSKWRFSTNPIDFENQIKHLIDNFQIVPLHELNSQNKCDQVSITFDDGYEDVYNIAYPILKKYELKATVFVLGLPTNVNRTELGNNLPLLRLNQIKHLYKSGWDIGYHTNTHADLFKLSNDELLEEIQSSKNNVENKLGFKLKYFAYPKGKYNSKIVSVVKKAGYTNAFTIDGGVISDKLYDKSRIPMEGKITIQNFEALTSWLGIYFSRFFMQALIMKEKLSSILKYRN